MYANILIRILAYGMDCFLLFVGLLVWQAALYFVNPIVKIINSGNHFENWQLHLWVFLTASIPFLLYFTLTTSSSKQATFGMRFFKLQVTDLEDNRIRFGKALLRSAVMLIPFELNHAVLFYLGSFDSSPTVIYWIASIGVWTLIIIYILTILVTPKSQSIHDLIASTVVRKTINLQKIVMGLKMNDAAELVAEIDR